MAGRLCVAWIRRVRSVAMATESASRHSMPAIILALAAAFGPLLGGATYGLRGAPLPERATSWVMMLAAWGGSYAVRTRGTFGAVGPGTALVGDRAGGRGTAGAGWVDGAARATSGRWPVRSRRWWHWRRCSGWGRRPTTGERRSSCWPSTRCSLLP